MTKGFGSKKYQVVVAKDDLFGFGRPILLARSGDRAFVELTSSATSIDVALTVIKSWVQENNIEVFECFSNDEKIECIELDSYIYFIQYTAINCDNPYAQKALMLAASKGIETQVEKAMSQGKNYIVMPNGSEIRFDESGNLNLDDFAKHLGIAPEKMMEDLNSPRFQRFTRSQW